MKWIPNGWHFSISRIEQGWSPVAVAYLHGGKTRVRQVLASVKFEKIKHSVVPILTNPNFSFYDLLVAVLPSLLFYGLNQACEQNPKSWFVSLKMNYEEL